MKTERELIEEIVGKAREVQALLDDNPDFAEGHGVLMAVGTHRDSGDGGTLVGRNFFVQGDGHATAYALSQVFERMPELLAAVIDLLEPATMEAVAGRLGAEGDDALPS